MNQSALPSDEPERWLPVVGYEGEYEVSDLGRVRSVDRTVRGDRGPQVRRGRVLAPGLGAGRGANGRSRGGPYLSLCLCRDGKRRRFNVHTLVARAFLGPLPTGQEVCHGPGGALDNRLVNLSYGTHAKNTGEDKRRDGTLAVGVRAGGAKLTDEIVLECRERAAAGWPVVMLASEFGVTGSAMSNAIHGRTWRHVPMPPRDEAA
jgi:hypothetical protein